ncbi:threonine/serine dehydratase [Pseudidiomarina halophila]|uniref:Serine/threonine dehydratase n=1 Tax=Pseudidiomarina halophila TaxID=1449799 RepID=A0A432XVU5_9GAMM|nr:threonine/serine dehydratase [Pseudidiomarina halophila]RUO52856.1 serine/threonine dehydratase [Pseudidiomarina halophila]
MMTFQAIAAAADRIAARALRTPVKRSDQLDAALGCQVYLKCENLQKSGAFKFRGACNALLQLAPEQRSQGVVTVSSGNHGAALACAGKMLGVEVTVGVASNASPLKRSNMLRYGAKIIPIEPGMEAREAFLAEQLEQGAIIIPPYDHPDIIAGQGTAALELLEDYPQLWGLVTPLGGGGLLSGSCLVAAHFDAFCYGVEPELAADGKQSLELGEIQPAMPPKSICDGLLTSLGKHTFAILQEQVTDVVLVSDQEVEAAQQLVKECTGMWIEPSSATTIAALKRYPEVFAEKQVGVIISGGNVPPRD